MFCTLVIELLSSLSLVSIFTILSFHSWCYREIDFKISLLLLFNFPTSYSRLMTSTLIFSKTFCFCFSGREYVQYAYILQDLFMAKYLHVLWCFFCNWVLCGLQHDIFLLCGTLPNTCKSRSYYICTRVFEFHQPFYVISEVWNYCGAQNKL